MRFTSTVLAAAAMLSTANAAHKGFNYGAFFLDQSAKKQADFEYEFKAAKALTGTSSQFTSARLYTMVQWQTTNTVIEAIQAAINTKTTLLLGMWASSGSATFDNEITALKAAITKYGTSFTDLVIGISVGSEDLYRISPTGIANKAGAGVSPNELISYVAKTRAAIKGTGLAGKPVGHVDTWTAYVNGSNSGVISALDFLGVDAYPYWETTTANSIGNANASFYSAYDKTVAAANGKPVWVTETGWPVTGDQQNQAVASKANARIYWEDVSCSLMKNNVNLFYYTLQDVQYGSPKPSFGIKPGGDLMAVNPLYDLSCPATKKSVSYSIFFLFSSALSPLFILLLYNELLVSALISSLLSGKRLRSVSNYMLSSSSTAHPPIWAQGPLDWYARADEHVKEPSEAPLVSSDSSTQIETSTAIPSTTLSISGTSTPSLPTTTAESINIPSNPPTPTKSSLPIISVELSGRFEVPSFMVSVDKSRPDVVLGNRYVAQISSTQSTLINFDIPPDYQGKICNLVFHVPSESQGWWNPWHITTPGGIVVSQLDNPATQLTSSSNVGSSKPVGAVNLFAPGEGHSLYTAPCAAGKKIAYRVDALNGLDLQYFQMTTPASGLFVTISS